MQKPNYYLLVFIEFLFMIPFFIFQFSIHKSIHIFNPQKHSIKHSIKQTKSKSNINLILSLSHSFIEFLFMIPFFIFSFFKFFIVLRSINQSIKFCNSSKNIIYHVINWIFILCFFLWFLPSYSFFTFIYSIILSCYLSNKATNTKHNQT